MVSPTVLPDLVYPFKDEGGSEELRYSLRSMCANADGKFGNVWIAGDLPEWATGVRHLDAKLAPAERLPGAYGRLQDMRHKATVAANHPDVASTLVWMNDDFFLCRPMGEWRVWHQGPAFDYANRMRTVGAPKWWLQQVESMALWAQRRGIKEPSAWQGHLPKVFDKERFAEALADYPHAWPMDVGGLYEVAGAILGPGERGFNVKVLTRQQFERGIARLDRIPWLSSADPFFSTGPEGEYIRGLFPEPCRYEKSIS